MQPWSNRQCATLLHFHPLHIATIRVECRFLPYSLAASFPSWGVASCLRVPSVVHDKKLGIAVFAPPPPFHRTPRYLIKTIYPQGTSILQKHRALRVVSPSAKTLPLQRLKDFHPDNIHPPPGYPSTLQKT